MPGAGAKSGTVQSNTSSATLRERRIGVGGDRNRQCALVSRQGQRLPRTGDRTGDGDADRERIAREEFLEMRGAVAGGLHRRHRLGRDARDLLEGQLRRQPSHVGIPAAGDDDPLHGQTFVMVQQPADAHVERLELGADQLRQALTWAMIFLASCSTFAP